MVGLSVTASARMAMGESLAHVRHLALDMDGTIYSGGTLFPETLPFLARLKELGIGHTFLTNNSSHSSVDYLAKLRRLGIEAAPDQLYTSTQATIEYLRRAMPQCRRLFLLATPSTVAEVSSAGFVSTADSAADEPDAVVVGFDTTLAHNRLCRAAWWISQGKPFVATHPDRICPTDEPTVLVDCGAICAALQSATGKAPDVVLGKPDPCMIEGILRRHSLKPYNLAMVGDRLYTDMEMARRAGAVGVLVLTGETKARDLNQAANRPDVVLPGLAELAVVLAESRPLTAARGAT
jgi:HAD superfamily hydrolase (TIGR01450 family)